MRPLTREQVNKQMTKPRLCALQVLYRAVNYQMEPVGSAGESEEIDSPAKVRGPSGDGSVPVATGVAPPLCSARVFSSCSIFHEV